MKGSNAHRGTLSEYNSIDRPEDVNRVKAMFMERIAIPHSKLEETFSSLSSFITQYGGNDYKVYASAMAENNKIASASRSQLSKLDPFEEQLVLELDRHWESSPYGATTGQSTNSNSFR